jgi:Ca2+ transporting ATPase
MISGDNLYTAIECAKLAGILNEGEERMDKVCMIGKDFRELIGGVNKIIDKEGKEKFEIKNKQNFKQIAQRLKVLARSTPEDKFALIVGLQEIGAAVAVTADGINDVGALKKANVGFCMGIAGCEVAKDAADIIILDDNFNSVFRAA